MRVLIANKFFFRNGGSEVVMFQERDFLQRQGHAVVDFAMLDDRNLESPHSSFFVSSQDYRGDGGKLRKLKSAAAFVHSSEAARKMGELIDCTRPELVHCHNIYHQLTPSIIGAAKARSVPVLLTLHDYKPVCPAYTRLRRGKPCSDCIDGDFSHVLKHRCAEDSFGKSALLFAEATIQRRLGNYEKVDRYIAPSRFMADSVAHRISAERISLLYNGVDCSAIDTSEADQGYVLYLGRLSAEKGVAALMAAHAASANRWPLTVAGTGPLEAELKAGYPAAKFAGHLGGSDLTNAIHNAALVVAPSEGYENCPMSVLEAMAYGKPVIGSRMGGIPELIQDGETGLLFSAGNVAELSAAITRLMNDPGMRRTMGRQARARAESHFSLEAHNRGLLGIYESVLQSHHKKT